MDALESDNERTERLLAAHRRRLFALEERQAELGRSADVSLALEIAQITQQIAELRRPVWAPAPEALAPRELVPEPQRPARHHGLIVLVGTGRPGEDPMAQSAGQAICYHLAPAGEDGLRACWLLASGGEHGSLAVAEHLKPLCTEHAVTARVWAIGDPFSVQETFDLVQWLYAHEVPAAGLSEGEVICDFTGGTKPMSAGMILACGARRPMQYMTGRKAGIASIPLLVRFAAREGL